MQSKKTYRIGIVGDVIPADTPLMSGQGVYSACGGDFSAIFSRLHEYSEQFDFMIGNFEAVLVEKIDRVSPATSSMKAPVSVLSALKQCNFRYMSVANNHTMEYGKEVFQWTCDQLVRSGIRVFGLKETPCLILDTEKSGRVGLFACSTVPAMYGFDPEYYFVDPNSPAEIDFCLERLREAKTKCDHLLVFPHWGNEFMTRPAPWQINLAQEMIASGTDAVFGAHPHVIQTACHIEGRPVFFSLGNLLSDYVQERFKRNAVVSLKIGHGVLEATARVFSCDRKFEIYDTSEVLALDVRCETSESEQEYADKANRMRVQVRNELISYLLKYPWRWVFNKGLWMWLVARAVFLAVNSRRIRKDPDAVYSGPIH
jgi:poly-gamma-glutamate synthesis protein (capsule biosynthesis protein)